MSMATALRMKELRRVLRATAGHWVGNGFPVYSLFSYPKLGSVLSPFLMLDYAAPHNFEPTTERRGVGEHPHRGFETVTIVYSGEVEHRDSAGGGGSIGPGDVQWMTAGSGLVHEEFHGRNYAALGGPFEMVQLWVNLPAKHKMTSPRYQGIKSSQIPAVKLPHGHGTVRVIAGSYAGNYADSYTHDAAQTEGPAQTFSPIHMWDLRLKASPREFELAVPEGYTTLLVVLKGTVRVKVSGLLQPIRPAEVGLFDRSGETLRLNCSEDVTALLLMGEPLDEPIVGSGPFVMNTAAEIRQAMADYQDGKMGHLN